MRVIQFEHACVCERVHSYPLTYIFRIRQIKILCKSECNFHFRLTLFYHCYIVVVIIIVFYCAMCIFILGICRRSSFLLSSSSSSSSLFFFFFALLAISQCSRFEPQRSRTMAQRYIEIQSISAHSFYEHTRKSIDQICQLSRSSIQFHCIYNLHTCRCRRRRFVFFSHG